MALVVETGSGADSEANSYISLVDAQAFVDARDLSVTLTEGLLLRAMDVLNSLRYRGQKPVATNPLPFPRTELYDFEGFQVLASTVPAGMADAQVWLAYYIEQGNDPTAMGTPEISSEKVDVISVQYAVKIGTTTRKRILGLPNVRYALRGLIYPSGRLDRA